MCNSPVRVWLWFGWSTEKYRAVQRVYLAEWDQIKSKQRIWKGAKSSRDSVHYQSLDSSPKHSMSIFKWLISQTANCLTTPIFFRGLTQPDESAKLFENPSCREWKLYSSAQNPRRVMLKLIKAKWEKRTGKWGGDVLSMGLFLVLMENVQQS